MKKLFLLVVVLLMTGCAGMQPKAEQAKWNRSVFYLQRATVKDGNVTWSYYPTEIQEGTLLIRPVDPKVLAEEAKKKE